MADSPLATPQTYSQKQVDEIVANRLREQADIQWNHLVEKSMAEFSQRLDQSNHWKESFTQHLADINLALVPLRLLSLDQVKPAEAAMLPKVLASAYRREVNSVRTREDDQKRDYSMNRMMAYASVMAVVLTMVIFLLVHVIGVK